MIAVTMHCPHACLSPCSTCEASKAARDLRTLRAALATVVSEHVKRCIECDAAAAWLEVVDGGGRDKPWCDACVVLPQRAISKGANRYQPQRITYAHWLQTAISALDATKVPA